MKRTEAIPHAGSRNAFVVFLRLAARHIVWRANYLLPTMNVGTAPPRSDRLGIPTDDERNDGDGNANPSCGGVEPSVDGSGKQTPPCLQKVTLDHAVAPLLPRPTAPFERTERKRAHTAAVYYSECVLQGITPKIADKAAEAADALHTKWWVRQTAGTTTEPTRAPQERNLGTENDRNKKLKIENGSASGDGCNEAGNRPDPIPTISEASLSSTLINAPLPISTTRAHFSEMLNKSSVEAAKVRMVDDLRSSGGSVETPTFLESLAILQQYYSRNGAPQTYDPDKLVGNWLTLSKPTYSELLGHNEKGEPLYSLGRMCFDMYKATNLVCSLQASFNNVQSIDPRNPGRPLRVPKRLMKDIQMGECRLHAYDIVVAVTIEPGQDRKGGKKCNGSDENSCYVVPKPIKSILTTQGYALPDPNIQNRLSIWFSGTFGMDFSGSLGPSRTWTMSTSTDSRGSFF